MANTTKPRIPLSIEASFPVSLALLSLSGHAVPATTVAPDVRAELFRLAWAEAVPMARGQRPHVCLTAAGMEARSAVLCAAADAAGEWSRRVPL